MATKLEAARIATACRHPGRARRGRRSVGAALAGEPVGTLFHATGKRRARKLLWLAYASIAQGELVLDAGAVKALDRAQGVPAAGRHHRRPRASSSPATRSAWSSEQGKEIARGLVGYDASELTGIIGREHP